MASSLTYLAVRKSVVNHLKNGGFMELPRQFTAINNWGAPGDGTMMGESRVLKTLYRYEVTDSRYNPSTAVPKDIPGCYVQAQPPAENYFAHWDVWGVEGLIGVDSLGVSLDGGHRLDVTFANKGTITCKQAMVPFDKFRGKPITVAVSGYQIKGDVKVTLKVDTGEVLESRPFYSRYFGQYNRMMHAFEIPTKITKFEISIVMEGSKGAVVGISGAVLAIGTYTSILPFSESPIKTAIPSGTVILWTGASCPTGYRAIADDTYLYAHVGGDPNSFRGDLTNPAYTRDVEIGENYHDHAAGTDERQPSAFDVRGTSFESLAVSSEGSPKGNIRVAGSPAEGESEYYEGVRVKTLPMAHNHLIKTDETPVEPPRIKVRICEKI